MEKVSNSTPTPDNPSTEETASANEPSMHERMQASLEQSREELMEALQSQGDGVVPPEIAELIETARSLDLALTDMKPELSAISDKGEHLMAGHAPTARDLFDVAQAYRAATAALWAPRRQTSS